MIFKNGTNDDKNSRSDRPFSTLLNASTIGMVFVTSIFIGTAIGYFLDSYLGTKPYLLLFFMLMGIIAGFKNAFYFVKKTGMLDDKEK